MHRTRIKICGITRAEDAVQAQALGVDALGLNFYAKSPRYIDLQQAKTIVASTEPLTSLVGLFVDPEDREVIEVLAEIPLGLLQFHGDETDEFCSSFQRSWIKGIRVKEPDAVAEQINHYPNAAGFILDSYVTGEHGGTGQTFDWNKLPPLNRPCLLAGGLNPENVSTAIRQYRPYGVDVSSGVESTPGIKDAAKMRAFILAVGRSDLAAREIS